MQTEIEAVKMPCKSSLISSVLDIAGQVDPINESGKPSEINTK